MIARFVGTSGRVPYNLDPRGKQYVTVIDPGHGDQCTIPYDTLELVNRNWKVMSF